MTRVLVVDDHAVLRRGIQSIVKAWPGWEIAGETGSGEEAVLMSSSLRPDIILMDISIPIIDGWEATQVLKHDPETNEIPIIALTAHALASDREKAMEVGCDGYLAKPFRLEEAKTALEGAFARRNGPSA